MKTRLAIFALALAAICHQPSTVCAQGNLTPSGPPAPTMKSLNQIEPRTPVDATHGDGLHKAVISEPGSYYLTTNIVGVGGEIGIYVATNNVTLDLNGFSVRGVSSSNDGIYIDDGYTNIVVRNGTISSWGGNGIYCGATDVTLEHLILYANFYGVYSLKSARVMNCTVNGSGNEGIHVTSDSIVTGCSVKNNTRDGILVSLGSGSSILGNYCVGNNTANISGLAGITIYGSNNRIEGNQVTVIRSGEYGISIINIASYTNNIVVKNSVQGGGNRNYSVGSSQIVGPLITNAVSGIITNSNPWANFSF